VAPSWMQILLVIVLIVLLFGRGKISELMGDMAKGIKSFKKGLSDEEEAAKTDAAKSLEHAAQAKPDMRTSSGSETKI